MQQIPRARKSHTTRNWFLIGLTAGAVYQAHRNPFWFLVSLFILGAIAVGLFVALLGTVWGWLALTLVVSVFAIRRANEAHPGWLTDTWRAAAPAPRSESRGLDTPGFGVPRNAPPIPANWLEQDVCRALVWRTNRERHAALAWAMYRAPDTLVVRLDGFSTEFEVSSWELSSFTFTNRGEGIIEVGVKGGGKYLHTIGSIRAIGGRWRCRCANLAVDDFYEQHWELAALHLFNIAENRVP